MAEGETADHVRDAELGEGAELVDDLRRREDSFTEIGLSSFSALEVRNRLCEATGLLLPSVLLFDHPTPVAVVRYLRGELTASSAAGGGGHRRTGRERGRDRGGALTDTIRTTQYVGP